jgi:hypothetical protein
VVGISAGWKTKDSALSVEAHLSNFTHLRRKPQLTRSSPIIPRKINFKDISLPMMRASTVHGRIWRI